MTDNRPVPLPRRSFIGSMVAALAVCVGWRRETATPPVECEHGMWLVEPRHSTRLCADCGIRQPWFDAPVVDSTTFAGRRLVITERSMYDMGPA